VSDSRPWWLPIAAWAGQGLVRLLGATWRFEVVRAPEYAEAERAEERFVYAFWHSVILPMAVLRRDEGIAVLVSRHRDGELITRIIEGLGYVTARGSSTRGGDAGVREMLAWGERGHHLAVTPDGPRGPREQAKPGVVYLTDRTHRRLVPIAVASPSCWVMRVVGWLPHPEAVRPGACRLWHPLTMDGSTEERSRSSHERFQQVLTTLTGETRIAMAESA
jgi:lysophospholipid acyltransferase (LPLAT)-like uncharacterized protein